jgi:hypothetical protein
MSNPDEPPKIHVDTDWKAQARAEKEKLAKEAQKKTQPQQAQPGESPQAAGEEGGADQGPQSPFEALVSTLATQALFAMGAFPDPRSGQRYQNLPAARQQIDMLGVLVEKTEGNLTDEERQFLQTTVYELRSRYIQISTAMQASEG